MEHNSYNNISTSMLTWLYLTLVSVVIMVFIGGITRLTDSGLSMVEWRPFLGIFPPLSEKEWVRVFELYKKTPEFIFYNNEINLDGFKEIFFWEYFHRIWGRFIGLIFIIPFTYFLIKNKLSKDLICKLTIILFFGVFQAILGWWMVESGFIKNPDISQYRLALHLSNAFIIMFFLVWVIMDIHEGSSKIKFNFDLLVLITLILTIIAGSFVAGMDAGLMYNTYPLMNDKFFPDDYGSLGIKDPFDNPASAQFNHRHLGFLALIALLLFYIKNFSKINIKFRLNLCLTLIIFQFILGIVILLNYVPIVFASMHQVGATLIFLIFTSIIHTQNKIS